jgi:hypothetical protein
VALLQDDVKCAVRAYQSVHTHILAEMACLDAIVRSHASKQQQLIGSTPFFFLHDNCITHAHTHTICRSLSCVHIHIHTHICTHNCICHLSMLVCVWPPRFEKAVSQVFGRTALCRNMDVAVQAARGNDVDCVTIDGDQAAYSRSGPGNIVLALMCKCIALR